ncbi:MAG: CynX/NimT family MFS transporter [Alphaproteobacteria bacterium]
MALAPTSSVEDTGEPPHPYRWAMLAGVWLLYFSFALTISSLAPLVFVIERDLGIDHALMGTILGAWPLIYIASSAPCGALLDRFGPRRMLFVAMTIIALSGVLRAFSDSYIELLLAIFVFGVGGPLVSSGAPKIVSLWFVGKARGMGIGIYFTGNALGGIAAVALTNSYIMPIFDNNWRDVLLAYAAFVFAAGVIWLFISAHPASKAVEKTLAAEKKTPITQVFFELLSIPLVRIILVMGIFILFFNHGLTHWLPTILQEKGMDEVTAGYWASIPTIFGLCTAPFIPRLATPEKRYLILFLLFAAAAIATLCIHYGDGLVLGSGLLMQGICRGSMTGIAILMLMDTDNGKHVGAASGLYFSAGEVGGALGPMTVGMLAQTTGGFSTPLFMMTGVGMVLILLLARLRFVAKRAG